MSRKILALIPARAGSLRVKKKNIRPFFGNPLLSYTIASAIESGLFDRVVCSTDSEEIAEIAKKYGAECPFIRPAELATAVATDIQWIKHAFENIDGKYDVFSILRPTSPFRSADTIRRGYECLLSFPRADSIRAVELCKQHPGKMWKMIADGYMEPFMEQDSIDPPWHARQYQDLPQVYIQNSSLEMAWTHVVDRYKSREGKTVAPFFTAAHEGFSIDHEQDWDLAELMVRKHGVVLPKVRIA